MVLLRLSFQKGLREYLPLKQGLRRYCEVLSEDFDHTLREYLPLKQGLRLHKQRELLVLNNSESIFH